MTVQESIDRLKDGHYNSDPLNADSNPGGFGADGHRDNFPAALQDVGIAAQDAGDSAETAGTARDASVSAKDDAVAARDVTTGARDDAIAAKDLAETAASSLDYASQVEAETGTEAAKAMSPVRTQQAIDARLADQGEAEAGTDADALMTPERTAQNIDARLADQAEAEAGTDAAALMTPERTAQSIDARLSDRLADQAEAEAGADAAALMTPERTTQTIDARLADQTEAEAGTDAATLMTPERTAQNIDARLADQSEAETGTDTEKLMTPKTTADALGTLGALAFLSSLPKGILVFTANGTLSKATDLPDDVTHIWVLLWGPGGSAGAGNTAGQRGYPGGGGGFCLKLIAVADLAADETITIGQGGAAQTVNGNAGIAGTDTTFGAHCSATGGDPGEAGTPGSASRPAAKGGIGVGGDLNIRGGCGEFVYFTSQGAAMPGTAPLLGGPNSSPNVGVSGSIGCGALGGNHVAPVTGGVGGPGLCVILF